MMDNIPPPALGISQSDKEHCQGRVTSFCGTELQRYTSFKAHSTADGPVRQILVNEKGVVALGAKDLHMSLRRGPTVWHLRYDLIRSLGQAHSD